MASTCSIMLALSFHHFVVPLPPQGGKRTPPLFIVAVAHDGSPKRTSLVRTSSAKILRYFCEIHLPRRRTMRRVCGMTLKVAPWAQMMYGFAVMMLPSANDVGLRPMMLRRCRKLRKLFAWQKATLIIHYSLFISFLRSKKVFHHSLKTRRSVASACFLLLL